MGVETEMAETETEREEVRNRGRRPDPTLTPRPCRSCTNTHFISNCIPCVLFCDWVISLRIIVSSYFYLPKNFMNSLFLIAK